MNTPRWRPALHTRIFAGLLAGALAGFVAGGWTVGPLSFTAAVGFGGDLFLRLLQMLVVPLIATSIITSTAKLGRDHAFGRLGLKTAGWYALTTLLACVTGLFFFQVFQPGRVSPEVSSQLLAAVPGSAEVVREGLSSRSTADVAAVLQRMIPPNIVAAASDNREMLAVIFFSMLFGIFSGRLPDGSRESFQAFWESANAVMLAVTDWVMRLAPVGIFCLMARTTATTGAAALQPLLLFFACTAAGLLFHFLVTLPLLLRLAGGVSPVRHLQAMLPALLTAFSTSSSSATLPLTLDCVQRRAGVSPRIAGFTLPLGATVNMDGTALYECAVVLFLAQLYGVVLGPGEQALIVLLALLTSVGVAGVPAASLVAIVIILQAVGLPMEAIAIVMATDRLLDMMRTVVNVYSDSCTAVMVARSEGEILPGRIDGPGVGEH